MELESRVTPDYGSGQKKLSIYIIGLLCCIALTCLSFWVIQSSQFSKWAMFGIIYSSAFIQFLVQVICFLRLNTQTEQSRTNVLSLLFTIVILISIVIGSLWIMNNLNYNMMM